MDKSIRLSVIVPVYNKEKFLDRCIQSILAQTYKNIEIILVDDGSTDRSAEICREYERVDNRVKYVRQTNQGLSAARNTGIYESVGDFISFIDADDWIEKNLYNNCIKAIKKYNCDVVDFNCRYVYKDECPSVQYYCEDNINVLEGKDMLDDYLMKGQNMVAPFSSCRKIFKKNLFERVKFPVGRHNEDISTNYKILMEAEKLVCLNYEGYYYFQGDNSICVAPFSLKDEDLLYASNELYKLAQIVGSSRGVYLADIKRIRSYFSLLSKIAVYGYDSNILDIKERIKIYQKELRCNIFKLLKSPMPISRKVLSVLYIINFNLSSRLLKRIANRK